MCLFLLSLTSLALSLSVAVDRTAAEICALPQRLLDQVRDAQKESLALIDRQASAVQRNALQAIREQGGQLNGQLGTALAIADRRLGETTQTLGAIREIRGDLQPVFGHAARVAAQIDDAAPLFLDCESNPDCLFNRYVGASKGIERAALSLGAASADAREALPAAIATWQRIGSHVEDATAAGAKSFAATQRTMENFAAASKPLPTWARIALGIGPPVAQMGAAGVAAGEALHWIH